MCSSAPGVIALTSFHFIWTVVVEWLDTHPNIHPPLRIAFLRLSATGNAIVIVPTSSQPRFDATAMRRGWDVQRDKVMHE